MPNVKIYTDKIIGKMKPMQSVNNGPIGCIIPSQNRNNFEEYKAARIAEREASGAVLQSVQTSASSGKEQYLKNKQAAADARKKKAQLERLRRECEELESELELIDEELFGSAAADYRRAAELDARKSEVEERLMEIYEILENE